MHLPEADTRTPIVSEHRVMSGNGRADVSEVGLKIVLFTKSVPFAQMLFHSADVSIVRLKMALFT